MASGTYPGGIPYQMALVQDKVEQYLDWLVECGFDGVEIAEDAMSSVMSQKNAANL